MDLYCTFKLDNEIYGISVAHIQEIIHVPKYTTIPRAKAHLKGVFSLRGQVVTNICLSTLFDKEASKEYAHSLVIQKSPDPLAINVNEILDIIEISPTEIEPVPDSIPERIRPYLVGIKKENDTLITILDISRIEL